MEVLARFRAGLTQGPSHAELMPNSCQLETRARCGYARCAADRTKQQLGHQGGAMRPPQPMFLTPHYCVMHTSA